MAIFTDRAAFQWSFTRTKKWWWNAGATNGRENFDVKKNRCQRQIGWELVDFADSSAEENSMPSLKM